MSKTSPIPPLIARERPGLSETLTGPRAPDRCQACGSDRDLSRWQECDPWDQLTPVIVVLCLPCRRRLIEPHPRLYQPLELNQPWPGAMALCVACRFRDGTRCTHPVLKANGGPGLSLTITPPTQMHVNRGRGRSGWIACWTEPAKACAGRDPIGGGGAP